MVFDDLEGAVREQTGVDFGTHFGNPRLPKPPLFARLLAIAGLPADTLTQGDNIKKR
jgi:hypothetical protein